VPELPSRCPPAVPVLRQCRLGAAIILHGLAVPKPDPGVFGAEHAIIIATHSDRRSVASQAVFKSLFGLTKAEAKVAHGICGGMTAATIAHEHGVALATVRTQIKSISQRAE
jgi:DNA-binding CsgD family transcriptional regulator